MKITIFSRLVIGFFAIFILAMIVNIYAIFQLSQLENLTKSILNIDNQLIDHEQKMSDYLLTMMRYEKKYIIMKDEGLLKHFDLAKQNFDKQFNSISLLANSENAGDILDKIRDNYEHYISYFNAEEEYIRNGREYSADNFRKEKENAINGIMEGIKDFKNYNQQNIYSKVKKLGEAEVNASNVAIVIGLISLVSGIIISIFITITITRPLSVIKKKTKEISKGNFGNDLDLTSPPEIKELANAFNLMCSKLKELDKMKSDFFSLMSHELRTPLTTIKEGSTLCIESLREGEVYEKQKRLLTIVNEECMRLINLVNSLLDLSKMEAGMMSYNFTRTDLGLFIDKVIREMEPLAETRNITIETKNHDGDPITRFDCDRILLVLRNLVGNAIKFTPHGGNVLVETRITGQGVQVSVTDTGAGISKDNLETIFDKYKQAAHSKSNKIKGSGLGLFIVKQIINAHGGKIWVESDPGQGSTFIFVLPF